MLACKEVELHALEYLMGRLPEGHRLELDEHVWGRTEGGCPACQDAIEERAIGLPWRPSGEPLFLPSGAWNWRALLAAAETGCESSADALAGSVGAAVARFAARASSVKDRGVRPIGDGLAACSGTLTGSVEVLPGARVPARVIVTLSAGELEHALAWTVEVQGPGLVRIEIPGLPGDMPSIPWTAVAIAIARKGGRR